MKGDEGRAFGSAGALENGVEDEGRGTSGPRGMNQAEQTLNFDTVSPHKSYTPLEAKLGYARGTPWPITILDSPVTPPHPSGNWPPPSRE